MMRDFDEDEITNEECIEEFYHRLEKERDAIPLVELRSFLSDLLGDEGKVEKIREIIENNFNLSPRGIREMLKLNNPIYEVTSAYGHFGRKPTNKGEFTWEKTDKIDLFKL